MAVEFRNYEFRYENEQGKPIFAPSDEGRVIGEQVRSLVKENYAFSPIYRHFAPGGHVGALHAHRDHALFARIDLKNFFYSVIRSRIQRALKECGVKRHQHFAKWSTVKNPYEGHGYVLPYGFVQSPILATLVFSNSALGKRLEALSNELTVTVYLDDIALSSDDPGVIAPAFGQLLHSVQEAGFSVNGAKISAPAPFMSLFNCDVQTGRVAVSQGRVDEFYSEPRSPESADAFERYCQSIAAGNS